LWPVVLVKENVAGICIFTGVKSGYLPLMRYLLFVAIALLPLVGFGQLTVDTTRTTITVREKSATAVRTLTIYRSFVPGSGIRHQAIYQPTATEFGEEPDILKLNFAEESVHIKQMLDAAMKGRQLNFSKLSINVLPYTELTGKLIEIYTQSPEWNDYLKKAANLKRTVTLFDGSEISEVAYNIKMAAWVLDKSDFAADMAKLFAPYGYTVTHGGFPDEHQQILSLDKLMLLGKDSNMFIPVPNLYFNLTKTKK
jgi:hypothetical protein